MGSISNSEIKLVKSLSNKKFRDLEGLFVVEGEKMVDEALKSSFEVVKVFYKNEIGEENMSRISSLTTPSPVLAIVKIPNLIHQIDNRLSHGLYLALDSIRDPGNLGTILRISDWFGLAGIFASEDTVDVFNPKVVQSSMGAIFRVKFNYTSLPSFCKQVIADGGKVYGTFLDGENIYSKDLSLGVDSTSVIVIGNESKGISKEVESTVNERLYIPPYPIDDPGSESLNAAIATAITLAEFRRRTQ